MFIEVTTVNSQNELDFFLFVF